MALLVSCSVGRQAAWPAAARELAARGAPATAGGPRRRARHLQCRCDAVEQQDGVTAAAPAPLLTSKTAQRMKVSMMSLGCPKNVVDGAPLWRRSCRLRTVPRTTAAAVRQPASDNAALWRSRGGSFLRVRCFTACNAATSLRPCNAPCCCRRGDAWGLVQRRLRHHGAQSRALRCCRRSRLRTHMCFSRLRTRMRTPSL